MANFTSFPPALAAELQTGFLEREFEEGLDSILAYRREALIETVPARIGETITRTRTGRLPPITAAMNPATNSGLDNGLTPADANLEQYQLVMSEYAHATDINLMDDMAAIANNLVRGARNNGVQAAQSLERLARQAYFGAYLGGNTRVRTDLGASTTTTCHVDDIRGFATVLVNGVPTSVSGSNTLTVQETAIASGGVTQALTVTGSTADVTNASSVPDGISGTLTFSTATAPVNGDSLVAVNAPKVLRPFSKQTTAQLTGSDVMTLGLIEDAVALMRDNAVPPMPGGGYHCVLDNTSLRQLWADQDFKVLFAGRDQSEVWRDGDLTTQMLGVRFIPTTETYVQNSGSGGTGFAAINTRVRRPMLIGAESLIQGNFEGLEMWLERQGVNALGDVSLINSVAHIIRPPLDRLQQFASLAWMWIGGFAVPTDATATTSIIPTATPNALYRRCCVIEHAG